MTDLPLIRDKLMCPQLDFIEKWGTSATGVAVKDWFVAEHLIGPLEGKSEPSEVTERAPTAPHVGPVEQLEAIRLGDRLEAGEWSTAARVNQRVTAARFCHVEVVEHGGDQVADGVGSGHG